VAVRVARDRSARVVAMWMVLRRCRYTPTATAALRARREAERTIAEGDGGEKPADELIQLRDGPGTRGAEDALRLVDKADVSRHTPVRSAGEDTQALSASPGHASLTTTARRWPTKRRAYRAFPQDHAPRIEIGHGRARVLSRAHAQVAATIAARPPRSSSCVLSTATTSNALPAPIASSPATTPRADRLRYTCPRLMSRERRLEAQEC